MIYFKKRGVMFLKKFLPAILCVFLSVTCLFSGAAAYEFPNAFWKINSAYTNAVNSGDLQGITEFGMQAVNLIKNEPESGILYGSCADGKIRENLNGESMFLLYHELTDSTTELERKYLNEAMEKGIAVEFSLNCPNEGDDIRSIFSKEAKLAEVCGRIRCLAKSLHSRRISKCFQICFRIF